MTVGADGRYSFSVRIGSLLRVAVGASSQPTYQPCVAIVSVSRNTERDVHVVVDANQLGAHLPAELLAETPTLSGTVFENTAEGRQPVAGVLLEVDMMAGLGDVSATTLTDSDGRYVLCGLDGARLPDGSTAALAASPYLWAVKNGFKTAEVGTVKLNGNTVRDIELAR
jgi:hypothetical protein